jgi:hypothetical protein
MWTIARGNLQERYTLSMDADTEKSFELLDQKLNAIYESVEKTRRYFLWMLITTVVMFVLPLVAILILAPIVLSQYTATYAEYSDLL